MQEGPERIDYNETPDVTEVHAAVKREHGDPRADVTPIPLWLTVICVVAVAWAGTYLGVFHGGFKGDVFDEYQSSPGTLFPLPTTGGGTETGPTGPVSLVDLGKGVYGQCAACHQVAGQGNPAQNYPPLAASEWVTGSEKRLVAILLKGVAGPITVAGKQVNGAAMPAWETNLSDKKIAGVASYIRANFGNSAPEISEAKVKAARAEFADRKAAWTESELKQIPEDATLPDAAGTAPAAAPGAKPAPAPAGNPATPPAPDAKPAPGTPPPPAPAPGAAPAPAPAAGFDLKASIDRGKGIYMQTCVACHMPTGLGVPGAFPPLTGTEYTQGEARRMVAMTLKGVNPPLKVKDLTYQVPMPPLPIQFPILADDTKLSDVINYVRNSFGNKDDKGVSPAMIDAVRKEFSERTAPWTEAELQNFPPAAK